MRDEELAGAPWRYRPNAGEGRHADATSHKPRFPIHIWKSLSQLPRRKALVKGLLDTAAMSVIFGASNSGKTFVAIDLAANLALGKPWRGRKLEQGVVIYIAAEGGLGIEERFAAFAQFHAIELGETPLYVMPAPLNMCSSSSDTTALIGDIKALMNGDRVALVVVDTLSRVMAGGNENAPDDMGAFVTNCDRLRKELDTHVAVIHHTGKEEARGARGHSLLRAAADTEIEISKDDASNIITATVTKQRDHKSGDSFCWRIETVEIGQDDDGDPVTSCVLVPTETEHRPKRRPAKLPNAAKNALDSLRRALDTGGEKPPASNYIPAGCTAVRDELWRRYCYEGEISDGGSESAKRKAFARSAAALQSAGIIGVSAGWVWLA